MYSGSPDPETCEADLRIRFFVEQSPDPLTVLARYGPGLIKCNTKPL